MIFLKMLESSNSSGNKVVLLLFLHTVGMQEARPPYEHGGETPCAEDELL